MQELEAFAEEIKAMKLRLDQLQTACNQLVMTSVIAVVVFILLGKGIPYLHCAYPE